MKADLENLRAALRAATEALEAMGANWALLDLLPPEERARLLTEAILGRGGEPSPSSGAWGSLVRMVERSALALGEGAAIAVLEEGEDHGRDDYLRDLDALEPSARQLVEFAILPEQRRTHDTVRAEKHSLS